MFGSTKYLILSDLHIPDHDIKSVRLVLKFIEDYKPDFIDLLGDQVNFTRISKYEQDPRYHVDLVDELTEAKKVLSDIVSTARKVNKNVTLTWFDGNHEDRLIHYLARNASAIAELNLDDEYVISIPHLLELKKLGVKYVPYKQMLTRNDVAFQHGVLIRAKSGYTGQASIEKYGASGFSGHTHRLSLSSKNQMGRLRWWVETGCLCNLSPEPAYTVYPDWCQGFAVCEHTHQTMYPQIVPILDHSFMFNGKVYA